MKSGMQRGVVEQGSWMENPVKTGQEWCGVNGGWFGGYAATRERLVIVYVKFNAFIGSKVGVVRVLGCVILLPPSLPLSPVLGRPI